MNLYIYMFYKDFTNRMWELHHLVFTAGKYVCYFIGQSFRWIQIQRERHRDRMKIWAPKVLGSNPSWTTYYTGHLGWAYITEHQFPHLWKRDNYTHDFKWANLLKVHTRVVGTINNICFFLGKIHYSNCHKICHIFICVNKTWFH